MTGTRSIPLSPIDHIFTGSGSYPIEFVFAYRGIIDADRLRSSFRTVLERFLPASSKLVRIADHSYAFEAAEDGANLEVIDSTHTFDDASRRHEFLDSVDSVPNEPLTRVRLTQTPRGSVLGVSMSHAVVDGFSYFHFLSTWARLFHGRRTIEPFHGRGVLIPEEEAERKPVTPATVRDDSGIFLGNKRAAIDRARMSWERRVISTEELSDLLGQAQRHSDIRLSYNDVVTALLWREYSVRWQAVDRETAAYVSCPVDFRRILTRCPPNYFGCAVSLASSSIPDGTMAEASIAELALVVHDAVGGIDEEQIWTALSTLEQLRRQEGLSVLERLHVTPPNSGLLVTNISRLPVLEIEFDAGPPVAFDILTPVHRGAVVLPADDGLDVRVCFIEEPCTGSPKANAQ
jgi:hypothetical protein